MHYTREQLEAMSTPELIKLYNRITGKSTKRFSSREAGIKSLLTAISERAARPQLPQGARVTGVRTVRAGKEVDASKSRAGRPQIVYSVHVAEGKSEVRASSLRGKILAHMKACSTASITELEEKFGEAARGAVQKLLDPKVGWLKRAA